MGLFTKKIADEDLGVAIARLCFTALNSLRQGGGSFDASEVLGRKESEIDWKEIVAGLFFVGNSTADAAFRSANNGRRLTRRARGASLAICEARGGTVSLVGEDPFRTMAPREVADFLADRATEYAELVSDVPWRDQSAQGEREDRLRILVLQRALEGRTAGVDLSSDSLASEWMDKALLLVATYVSALPSRFRLP